MLNDVVLHAGLNLKNQILESERARSSFDYTVKFIFAVIQRMTCSYDLFYLSEVSVSVSIHFSTHMRASTADRNQLYVMVYLKGCFVAF